MHLRDSLLALCETGETVIDATLGLALCETGETVIDATLGLGGHAAAFVAAVSPMPLNLLHQRRTTCRTFWQARARDALLRSGLRATSSGSTRTW